jgi:hypothetical protein
MKGSNRFEEFGLLSAFANKNIRDWNFATIICLVWRPKQIKISYLSLKTSFFYFYSLRSFSRAETPKSSLIHRYLI